MEQASNRKRSFCAWLLLLTLFAQRIVFLVGSEFVYAVEVESRMNLTEELIAEKLRMETGLEIQIRIQDQERLDHLMKLGYSTPFIFTEELEGETVYYTLDHLPKTTIEYGIPESEQPDAQAPPVPPRLLKDKLISDFYFWESTFLLNKNAFSNTNGITLQPFWQDHFIQPPSPPPKTV